MLFGIAGAAAAAEYDDLRHGDFEQGNLQQGDFEQGNLQQGDFEQGNLQHGEFEQDNLRQGDFGQGNLRQDELPQSSLRQDDLRQGEFEQGNLRQDDLQQDAGDDITLCFGEGDTQSFHIHVNPKSESEIETEAATETEAVQETEASGNVYVYEDSKVRVTATLEKPGAVPADAIFRVTEVTPDSKDYNYDAYMEALNDGTQLRPQKTPADGVRDSGAKEPQDTRDSQGTKDPQDAGDSQGAKDPHDTKDPQGMKISGGTYDETNTLLYDVAFIMQSYDEAGNVIEGGEYEYQPEEGAVDIRIEFKKGQLTDNLGITDEQDVTITHLPLSDEIREQNDTTAAATDISMSDISVEPIPADSVTLKDGGADQADFQMESFSVISISGISDKTVEAVPGASISAESVLGGSIYYGVTANDWYFDNADSETSMAVGTWHGTGGQNGSNDSKSKGAQCQYIMVGKVDGWLNLKGYKAYLTSPYSADSSEVTFSGAVTAQQKLQNIVYIYKGETAVKNDVSALIAAAQDMSDALAQRDSLSASNYGQIPAHDNAQKYTIDLTGLPDGTYYINTQSWPDLVAAFRTNGGVTIKKNDAQQVVFYFPNAGTYEINKFHVVNDGTSHDSVSLANTTTANGNVIESIVFNFPNAENLRLEDAAGIFLAPKAEVNTYGVDGGWVVCREFRNHCEWHLTYHKVYEEGSSATFQARKRVNGQYAAVSGFTFKLEKQTGADTWEEVQSVQNSSGAPGWISFDTIEYNSNTTQDAGSFPHDYIYRITEPGETTQLNGVTYTNDESVYYARVTVDVTADGNVTKYHASHPEYFIDAACTAGSKISTPSGFPEFDNTAQGTSVTVNKKWFRGTDEITDPPVDSIAFDLYRLEHPAVPQAQDTSSSGASRANGSSDQTVFTDFTLTLKYRESNNTDWKTKTWQAEAGDTIHIVARLTGNALLQPDAAWPYSQTAAFQASNGTVISTETASVHFYNDTVGWNEVKTIKTIEFNFRVPQVTKDNGVDLTQFTLWLWIYDNPNDHMNLTIEHQKGEKENSGDNGMMASSGTDGEENGSAGMDASSDDSFTQEDAVALGGVNTWDGVTHSYTVRADEGWTKTIDDLPTAGYNSSGQAVSYTYYVVERNGAAYNVSYENNQGVASGVIRINNTVQDGKTEVSGQKTWLDADDLQGLRPEKIVIHLYQNGSPYRQQEVTGDNDWSYSFTELPKADASGEQYVYTIAEEAVSGYRTFYDGYNVINASYTSLQVSKQWLSGRDGGSVRDITSKKGGSVSFVIRRELYRGNTRIENSDSDVYAGGTLRQEAGVACEEATHEYTITAQETTDASGRKVYTWPTAFISDLPVEVEAQDGSETFTCKYYVVEVGTGGMIDATYKVGSGDPMGTCASTNNGASVTIINREMHYSLPATGGEGTRRIYLVSLTLIALAGLGLMMIRRRRDLTVCFDPMAGRSPAAGGSASRRR